MGPQPRCRFRGNSLGETSPGNKGTLMGSESKSSNKLRAPMKKEDPKEDLFYAAGTATFLAPGAPNETRVPLNTAGPGAAGPACTGGDPTSSDPSPSGRADTMPVASPRGDAPRKRASCSATVVPSSCKDSLGQGTAVGKEATYARVGDDKKAAGLGSASAQAVKRGHQVAMIEVPDEEDDFSYQKWVANGSPTISPKRPNPTLPTPPDSPTQAPMKPIHPEVTSPTVATPSMASAKAPETPQGWLKPDSAEWTLHALRLARTDNAAHAHLSMWIHDKRYGELTDELLQELRTEDWETAREHLYELHKPIHYIRGASGDFMIPVTLEPCTG